MAVNAGGIFIDIGLNSARFQEGLKGAGRQLDRFGKNAGKISGVLRGAFAGIGAGLAAGVGGVGLAGLFAGAKTAAADLAQLNAEAQRAGLGVEAFQRLGYAAKGVLVNIDAVTDGLKEMSLRADEYIVTGQGSAAEAFQRLGLSVDDVKKQLNDPEAFFQTIIDQLSTLDKASQIRIADEIFGGTGGEQFVRFLSQGVGYIKRMGQEAEATGNVLDAELVQRAVEIDRQFAKLSTTIGANLKGALVSVVSLMRDFSDMLNSTEAQSAGTLRRRIELLKAAAENMQRSSAAFAIGGGQEGIDRRLAEAAELQKQLDSRPGTSITVNAPGGQGDTSKIKTPASQAAEDLAKSYASIVASAEQRIAQMGVEQQALGLTTAEAEKLRVKTELLNELQRAGITLTPEYAAKIEELAQRSGEAAAALETQTTAQAALIASMDEVRGVSYDVLGGFVQDLKSGISATEALGNALSKVGDKLLDIGLQNLLSGLLGAPGTTSGGLLGSLLGTAPVKLAAGGKVYGPGTATSDSVPAMLSRGEYVVNARQAAKYGPLLERINSGRGVAMAGGGFVVPAMRAPRLPAMAAGRAAGGAMSVTYAPRVTIEAGASAEAVAQLHRVLDEDRRSFASRTVRVIQDAQRRNVRI